MSDALDEILLWPDRALSTPTKAVTDFGPSLRDLIERMKRAMAEAEGIGLAANQMGESQRVALVSPLDGEMFVMVNPRITALRGEVLLDEACLSLPGEGEKVKRAVEVEVVFQDAAGAEHTLTARDRVAHIIQHEVDHLEGRVYVQHLGPVKRDLIRRRMEKRKREGVEEDDEGDDGG
jgi:peptide deformylase